MPTHILENFESADGSVRRQAVVSYRAHGKLNPARDNVIVFPTPFGGRSDELDWMAGPDGLFDTSRYFLVVIDTFGNGLSESPVMVEADRPSGQAWQPLTLADSVNAQRRLLAEVFGVDRLALAAGWSIGGQQAYQWATAYPEAVERLCVICGSARTAPHNFVFLEGVRAALEAVMRIPGGEAEAAALRVAGRIYAGWALSQSFYRNERWRPLGYRDLEDFLARYWEGSFAKRRAANVLAQIGAWQRFDISDNSRFSCDLAAALRSIKARTLLLPCAQDLYFRVQDNEREARYLQDAVLQPMVSDWGHRAGLPAQSPEDRAVIRAAIARLLG